MIETELKILNISVPEITRKLLALGAKKKGTLLIVAEHFDFPDRRIREADQLVRLRKVGEKTELCFKGRSIQSKHFKIKEEIETHVEDYAATKKILEQLGLHRYSYREKKRTSFALGKLKIEIDQYPKIPAYMEIEGTQAEIKKLLPQLGYTLHDTTTMTAGQVLRFYGIHSKVHCFKK